MTFLGDIFLSRIDPRNQTLGESLISGGLNLTRLIEVVRIKKYNERYSNGTFVHCIVTFLLDEQSYFECFFPPPHEEAPLTEFLMDNDIMPGSSANWDHNKHIIEMYIDEDFVPELAEIGLKNLKLSRERAEFYALEILIKRSRTSKEELTKEIKKAFVCDIINLMEAKGTIMKRNGMYSLNPAIGVKES